MSVIAISILFVLIGWRVPFLSVILVFLWGVIAYYLLEDDSILKEHNNAKLATYAKFSVVWTVLFLLLFVGILISETKTKYNLNDGFYDRFEYIENKGLTIYSSDLLGNDIVLDRDIIYLMENFFKCTILLLWLLLIVAGIFECWIIGCYHKKIPFNHDTFYQRLFLLSRIMICPTVLFGLLSYLMKFQLFRNVFLSLLIPIKYIILK